MRGSPVEVVQVDVGHAIGMAIEDDHSFVVSRCGKGVCQTDDAGADNGEVKGFSQDVRSSQRLQRSFQASVRVLSILAPTA